MKKQFELDSRLEKDTFFVLHLGLCDLRLMKDARWPWLILVPRIADMEEIHHLTRDDQHALLAEVNDVAIALEAMTGCGKINIAALGNMVRQLHVHIVARNQDDTNWPHPVWSVGSATPYQDEQAEKLIKNLQQRLD